MRRMVTWSERISAWALRTFGQGSEKSLLRRFEQELEEFYKADTKEKRAEEAADMVITLCNYTRSLGYDLAHVVYMKEFVNNRREWVSHGDGTGQHVKNSKCDIDSAAIFSRLWNDDRGQESIIMSNSTPETSWGRR